MPHRWGSYKTSSRDKPTRFRFLCSSSRVSEKWKEGENHARSAEKTHRHIFTCSPCDHLCSFCDDYRRCTARGVTGMGASALFLPNRASLGFTCYGDHLVDGATAKTEASLMSR